MAGLESFGLTPAAAAECGGIFACVGSADVGPSLCLDGGAAPAADTGAGFDFAFE